MRGMIDDFMTLTVRTCFFDNLALSIALVTYNLTLSEHSRENLWGLSGHVRHT